MGLIGRLMRVFGCSRKQCRGVYRKMQAVVKKVAVNSGLKSQQLKFQYDISSYALNFDDGRCKLGDVDRAFLQHKFTWIYVITQKKRETVSSAFGEDGTGRQTRLTVKGLQNLPNA